MHQNKVKEEVNNFKQEKDEQKQFLQMQRQQEYLKNTSLKHMIKQQATEAQERKKRDLAEKQERARQQIANKMMSEEEQRLNHEAMVQKMEQEELELIQRLQNTQLLQKAAYEDLENALGTPAEPSDSRPGTSSKKSAKGKKWCLNFIPVLFLISLNN